jgi:hypothetical protein
LISSSVTAWKISRSTRASTSLPLSMPRFIATNCASFIVIDERAVGLYSVVLSISVEKASTHTVSGHEKGSAGAGGGNGGADDDDDDDRAADAEEDAEEEEEDEDEEDEQEDEAADGCSVDLRNQLKMASGVRLSAAALVSNAAPADERRATSAASADSAAK